MTWSFLGLSGVIVLGMPKKSKHSLLVVLKALLYVVLKASRKIFEAFYATETWLISSSFFFASKSILDVISYNVFNMSLFCCNKSFYWRVILPCNAKKDAIKLSLLIFFNCPLVRICSAMINWKLPFLKTYVRTAWWLKMTDPNSNS